VVITVDERSAFAAAGGTADLERYSQTIQKKCMDQMLRYEGGDPAVEAQTGSNKKGTYLAIGGRVRLYKNFFENIDRQFRPAAARPPSGCHPCNTTRPKFDA
jgi:hypothetical protein